jgi:outer membrane protein insertion porin family
MQLSPVSPVQGCCLIGVLVTTANLLFVSTGWAQSPPLERPSTEAIDLLPEVLDPAFLEDASAIRGTFNPANREWEIASETSAPTPEEQPGSTPTFVDQTNFTIQATFGESEKQGFSFDFGASAFAAPTALQGPNRSYATSAQAPIDGGDFPIPFYIQQRINQNQRLALELTADPIGQEELAFDLGYAIKPDSLPGFFAANFSNTRSTVNVFDKGRRNVRLVHGQKPWLHRLGGGVEYFQPFLPTLGAAFGVNYQRVSVRNRAFTSRLSPRDELGNPLTFSDTGQDDLLTLNLSAYYRTVDNPAYATQGTKAKFGLDQSIPVGNASITYTRLSGSVSQFIPLNLFGFTQGPRTLVLHLQGGTMFGDVPAYEAFTLGGSSTVRSYDGGTVGSGSSFILAAAEYRFPIVNFTLFQREIQTRGVLFAEYGSVLGTESEVRGNPSKARLKPGDGASYGFGLHVLVPFGLLRVEVSWNDRGGSEIVFDIGDRF